MGEVWENCEWLITDSTRSLGATEWATVELSTRACDQTVELAFGHRDGLKKYRRIPWRSPRSSPLWLLGRDPHKKHRLNGDAALR